LRFVAEGYGYRLGTLSLREPISPQLLTLFARVDQPVTEPPAGLKTTDCVRREWQFELAAPVRVQGELTLEYLHEHSRRKEFADGLPEHRLVVWQRREQGWQPLPTHTNALANTLTVSAAALGVAQPRFIACVPHEQADQERP
jgi:hypothetical protein